MKTPLLISACLLGENCKYNGGNNDCPAVEQLKEHYELYPVCPERDGGLPTPRVPSERLGDRVVAKDGTDVTVAFQRGAEIALQTALSHGCQTALFKERSPSCGCGEIYDGTFSGTVIARDGVTAELLKENAITVVGESQIKTLLQAAEDQRDEQTRIESDPVLTAALQELLGELKRQQREPNTSVLVLKTAKGTLWHFSFSPVPYRPEQDREFLETLRQAEDTEVQYLLVCHCCDEALCLDIPGWAMREGLSSLHPANANARIFLHGERDGAPVYLAKTLKSLG